MEMMMMMMTMMMMMFECSLKTAKWPSLHS